MTTPVVSPFDRTRRLLTLMFQPSSTPLPLTLIGQGSRTGDRDPRLAAADHPRRVLFERLASASLLGAAPHLRVRGAGP